MLRVVTKRRIDVQLLSENSQILVPDVVKTIKIRIYLSISMFLEKSAAKRTEI